MKTIKRVLVLLIMILVVVIYLTNKDTKIYYVSLGDGLGRGMNANDKIGYGYSDYIKEYLEDIDKLEFYTKQFSDKDKRTTDIINNINDNIDVISSKNENDTNINNNINVNNTKKIEKELFTPDDTLEYSIYRVYTMKDDDTLEYIYEKYNVNKEILAMYNDLDNLKVGSKIIIPSVDE